MKAIRLAFALIRVPQLFLTLVAFPLFMSIVLLWAQFLITGQITHRTVGMRPGKNTPGADEERWSALKEGAMLRELLYGSSKPIPAMKICRWVLRPNPNGGEDLEYPPSDDCNPEKLDVAIRTKNVAFFDTAPYQRLFEGNISRLHVCETCDPDVVIEPGENGGKGKAFLKSVYGSLVLTLSAVNPNVVLLRQQYYRAQEERENLVGAKYFFGGEFSSWLDINGMIESFPVLFNVILLVLMALWLSLKAHRKVLDYFARSGALLPLVAASGNANFYRAIWILTFMRVGSFLMAAIPMTILSMVDLVEKEKLSITLFDGGMASFLLWTATLLLGLGLATILASVADLKHRQSMVSFVYRYVPIVLAIAGGLLWSSTFISIHSSMSWVRESLVALPIVGLAPMMVAPLIHTKLWVMATHLTLTLMLLVVSLRKNARWFAAHLEEI